MVDPLSDGNDLPKLARQLETELSEVLRERDEAREVLREIEDKMRVQLRGHPESELWGDAGLIAATMRCVDALDVVTEQRDEAREALMKIEEVFIDSDDTYEALGKMGNIARAALESKNYDPVT
jgi:hypothetical protein